MLSIPGSLLLVPSSSIYASSTAYYSYKSMFLGNPSSIVQPHWKLGESNFFQIQIFYISRLIVKPELKISDVVFKVNKY